MLNSECREDEASKLLKGGGKRAFIVCSGASGGGEEWRVLSRARLFYSIKRIKLDAT